LWRHTAAIFLKPEIASIFALIFPFFFTRRPSLTSSSISCLRMANLRLGYALTNCGNLAISPLVQIRPVLPSVTNLGFQQL
ncbi:MAG: hypothetical protein ACYDHG_04680, partial [Desulfomonilaceae bacterium]